MKTSDILEARSNPERNKREHAIETLMKYKGQKDVFVSFTSGFTDGKLPSGRQDSFAKGKIGINPKSDYNTPIGIYTYPVDYIINYSLEKDSKYGISAPYTGRGIWKFLYILRRTTTNYVDSKTDISPYYAKLTKLIRESLPSKPTSMIDVLGFENETSLSADQLITNASEQAKSPDNPFSVFWNTARNFSHCIGGLKSKYPIVTWNVLMRQLGIDQFVDDKGYGVIHEAEPTQAVFFLPNSIFVSF